MLWHSIDSPQVKRDLISNIINFVHALAQELPNNLRFRIKIENIKKISKLVGGRA